MLCELVSPSNFSLTFSSPLMKTGPRGCLIGKTRCTLLFIFESKCSVSESELKLTTHSDFPHYALDPAWLCLHLTLTLTYHHRLPKSSMISCHYLKKISSKLHFPLVFSNAVTIPLKFFLLLPCSTTQPRFSSVRHLPNRTKWRFIFSGLMLCTR